MTETEKYEIYLKKIEAMYPLKSKLNKSEVCRVIGISTSKFVGIIDSNDLHLLPKHKIMEQKTKNGKTYRNYSFDIHDVAMFLAQD